jgi:hypothetical protein
MEIHLFSSGHDEALLRVYMLSVISVKDSHKENYQMHHTFTPKLVYLIYLMRLMREDSS